MLFLGMTILLVSCTQNEVKLNELTCRNGILCYKTDTIPFTGKVKETFPSGQTSLTAKIDSGRFNGYYLTYFENGKIKDSVLYNKGIESMHKRFLPNGDINKISEKLLIHKNGKAYFKEDKKDLTLFTGLAIDTMKDIVDTITGRFNPSAGFYYVEKNYLNGTINGEAIEYFQKGNTRKMSGITNYMDDKKNGKSVSYYLNGKMRMVGQYHDDMMDGKWVYYNDNGKVSHEGSFDKGKNKGTWKYYFGSGKLKETKTYTNGYNNYSFVDYYNNGNIKQKGNFKNGNRDGDWVWYYMDGGIDTQTKYASGKTLRRCDCCNRYYNYNEGWCSLPRGFSSGYWDFMTASGGPYCSKGCAMRCR